MMSMHSFRYLVLTASLIACASLSLKACKMAHKKEMSRAQAVWHEGPVDNGVTKNFDHSLAVGGASVVKDGSGYKLKASLVHHSQRSTQSMELLLAAQIRNPPMGTAPDCRSPMKKTRITLTGYEYQEFSMRLNDFAGEPENWVLHVCLCLLYTSDAADD